MTRSGQSGEGLRSRPVLPDNSDKQSEAGTKDSGAANTLDMYKIGMEERKPGEGLRSSRSLRDLREERDKKLEEAEARQEKYRQFLRDNPAKLKKPGPGTKEKAPLQSAMRRVIKKDIQEGYKLGVEIANETFDQEVHKLITPPLTGKELKERGIPADPNDASVMQQLGESAQKRRRG
jgi:hypothetical protein